MNNLHYQSGVPSADGDLGALYFVSLGGAGEIGMNLNLYGYDGDWLILDCGVTFGDDSQPGLEVVMPDPAFIVERRDRLLGIVATHAHEDHIGAIPYLWTQLRCPVWATPFTASLLRAKLIEAGLADKVTINVVPMSGRFTVGPFDLELITLTHSIPEPNAVALRGPADRLGFGRSGVAPARRRRRPGNDRRLDKCVAARHLRLGGGSASVANRSRRSV